MSKYFYLIIGGIVLSLSCALVSQRISIQKYKSLYNRERQNVEAYKASNSGLENEIRQFKMTVDELRASKDSTDKKILKIVDSLKIKDKRIESLQYQYKTIYKTDTIHTADTLLIPEAHVDTIVGDKWYKLDLKLDYPNRIVVSPEFISEEYVVINTKKEYNKKPSKIFFVRWFQKKHTVTEVNVVEKNPYINTKERKYIQIE
jgi:hypothetical protein